MSKYYIRLDEKNRITHGYSDYFTSPEEGDICIEQEGWIHFKLFGEANPPLCTIDGIPLYKYVSGAIVQRTDAEVEADRAQIVHPDSLEQRIADLEEFIAAAAYGGVSE